MDFLSFLQIVKQNPEWLLQNNKNIIFLGKTYTPLLFSKFFAILKNNGLHVKKYVWEELTCQELQGIDQLSFFSSDKKSNAIHTWYWLGDTAQSHPQKTDINKYVTQNISKKFWWFCAEKQHGLSDDSALQIHLPEFYTKQSASALVDCFDERYQKPHVKNFMHALFSHSPRYTADQLFLMLEYAEMVSKPMYSHFFEDWFKKIITHDASLFSLSGAFFSGQSKDFFLIWNQIKHEYGEPFWITFWSDQLYRAASYCWFMERHDALTAKQFAHKLPFSFVNYQWKKYSSQKLAQLHNELSMLDYALKNSADKMGIDIFFIQALA
jgi:hypothetical protein